MDELHDVQFEDPVSADRVRPLRRLRLFPLVLGVAAAFCGALALSALFAHPAGASTLAGPGVGPGGTPPIGVVSTIAQPVLSALGTAVDPQDTPDAVTPVIGTVRNHVAPLTAPITRGLASSLGPVVRTVAPLPVIASVVPSSSTTESPLPRTIVASLLAPTAHAQFVQTARGAQATARGASGGSPISPPSPISPFPRFPLLASSSPAGDATSSPGSNALAVAPISGLLLPDQTITGVLPAQSRMPQLLFDLRSSPPG
jgi:hypothetical protein